MLKLTQHRCRTARGLLWLALLLCSPSLSAATATVAVAANFAPVLARLAPIFEAQTEHTVTPVVGATGLLYTQIVRGAPYDVLLAADTDRPQRLYAAGLSDADPVVYAQGQLAFWQPGGAPTPDLLAYLQNANNVLALANPRVAPYGAAAEALIDSLTDEQSRRAKRVYAENIGGAYTLVASGNAGAGLVALSQCLAQATPPAECTPIARTAYPPILQAAVLTQRGAANPAGRAFMVFLQSSSARKVIADAGYVAPERSAP